MERAQRLVREADFLDREYKAFLREANIRLEECLRVREEARELMGLDGATVEQLREVFDA